MQTEGSPVTILLLVGMLAAAESPAMQPRIDRGAPGEIPGRIIHGAGQSFQAVASYIDALGPVRHPAIIMQYARADRSATEQTAATARFAAELALLPADVGIQLGLAFSVDGQGSKAEYSAEIVAGQHDAGLTALAVGMAALRRQVFVRIGYECNGKWNGYPPAGYRAAFAHIAALLRKHCPGVATVWCVHPQDRIERLREFDPGDAHADWWSIDLFEPEHLRHPTTLAYLALARAHGKPVMIGESTPTGVGVGGARSWDTWYAPYFALIRRNPQIKALCYINWQWGPTKWATWGDARIETAPVVLARYAAELDDPAYAHAAAPPPRRLLLAPERSSHAAATEPLGPTGVELAFDLPAGMQELVSLMVVIRKQGKEPAAYAVTIGDAAPRELTLPPTSMVYFRSIDLRSVAVPANRQLRVRLSCTASGLTVDRTRAALVPVVLGAGPPARE